ncbi:MAG: hypothetical protein ACOCVQ_03575 [Bacillota bacterium]
MRLRLGRMDAGGFHGEHPELPPGNHRPIAAQGVTGSEKSARWMMLGLVVLVADLAVFGFILARHS